MDYVDVSNPFFDYISPELVSLFITNLGGHPPSYIYRLLGENYNVEDYCLDDNQGDVDEVEITPVRNESICSFDDIPE
jgi:hypothetical protein